MNSHPEDTQRHESDLLEAADRIAELRQQLATAEKRAKDAEAWKESMLNVMPPMQEIGNELGVLLGDSIHDKILPGIQALKAQLAIFKPCVELYANQAHWRRHVLISDRSAWWGRGSAIVINEQGYEPAQAALRKVEERDSNKKGTL